MTGLVHLDAVTWMTARGWRLLPVRAGGKEPLTPHGVKDATADTDEIKSWLRRWPDANIAVACGAPGPQVLDIDNRDALPTTHAKVLVRAPRVAAARGPHCYFAGTDQGTIKLPYGELRGRGSYVVCPPSIHPSGKPYTWPVFPHGPLPPVPALIARAGKRRGDTTEDLPRDLVPHSERHPYLLGVGERLLRVGFLDKRRLEAHLEAEFNVACDPHPPARPNEFSDLAKWLSESRNADHQRSAAEFAARWAKRAEGGA